MLEQIPKTPTDDELIEVLSAISIVALRLAKKLQAVSQPARRDTAPQCPRHTCPLYQERRKPREAI